MDKIEKFVRIAFKTTIGLYVVALVFHGAFRPDIYRLVSVTLQTSLGIIVTYFCARWVMVRVGVSRGGFSKANRTALFKILGLVCLLIIACAGAEYLVRNFSLTKQAIGAVQSSSEAKQTLGSQIQIGWLVGFQIKIEGGDGAAALSIPVKGSKAAGRLKVKGIETDGSWHIVELYLNADEQKSVVQIPH